MARKDHKKESMIPSMSKSICPRSPVPPPQRAPLEEAACCEGPGEKSESCAVCLEKCLSQPSVRSQTSPAHRHLPPAICPRLSLAYLLGAENSENGPQGPAGPAQPPPAGTGSYELTEGTNSRNRAPWGCAQPPLPTTVQSTIITAGM